MKRSVTVFIMLAIGSMVFAQDKKPEQKAVFCSEQFSYAKDSALTCEQRCATFNCSAKELIEQGWSIKIVTNKELIVEKFELVSGLKERIMNTAEAREEICARYECFTEGRYWFFWKIRPKEKGCKCIGKEYILER